MKHIINGKKTLLQELELGRAVWHAIIIAVLGFWGLASAHHWVIWVAFFAMTLWEILRRRFPILSHCFFIRFVIREKERVENKITTATYVTLALILIVYCFDNAVASSAILIASLADPSARIVGKLIGRHRIGAMQKTWEGTGACFLVAFAIVLVLQHWRHGVPLPLAAALAGIGGAATVIAELLIPHFAPDFLDDNFWIPFLSAAALHAGRWALLGQVIT